jgi:hypothetical protein
LLGSCWRAWVEKYRPSPRDPFAGSELPLRFLLRAWAVGMKPERVPDGRVWEVSGWKGMAKINKRLEV